MSSVKIPQSIIYVTSRSGQFGKENLKKILIHTHYYLNYDICVLYVDF